MNWPTKVQVIDVTPRDGLQDADFELNTAEKAELIRRLYSAGIKEMETTSFVSPRWVPRMRDAEAVAKMTEDFDGTIALVPNLKGFERALTSAVSAVTFVVSVSPIHQQENLRMSLEDSWRHLSEIVERRGGTNMPIRGAISCAFGSPFAEETIAASDVAAIAAKLVEFGANEIGLADTVGVGIPQVMSRVICAVQDKVGDTPIAVHLHDRFNLGQGNIVTALACGITRFEAALCGLGGCPFAPDAPGNLNIEKLVQWLHLMEIETGIDEVVLADTSRWLQTKMQAASQGAH